MNVLTLDEAIKHCEEVAEKQKEKGFLANAEANRSTVYGEKCYRCASVHRQLAEWLERLKAFEEAYEEIKGFSIVWEEGQGIQKCIKTIKRHLKEK